MKTILMTLSISGFMALSACSDKALIGSKNKSKKESFNLEAAYTGPGKDYKPTVDPNKNWALYKVTSKKFGGGCFKVTLIEDQIENDIQCLKLAEKNQQRDELDRGDSKNRKGDYTEEELKALGHKGEPTELPGRWPEPNQFNPMNDGVAPNWRYVCHNTKSIRHVEFVEKYKDKICNYAKK